MMSSLNDLLKTLLSNYLSMLLRSAVQVGKLGQVCPCLKSAGQRRDGQFLKSPSVVPFGHDYVFSD